MRKWLKMLWYDYKIMMLVSFCAFVPWAFVWMVLELVVGWDKEVAFWVTIVPAMITAILADKYFRKRFPPPFQETPQ